MTKTKWEVKIKALQAEAYRTVLTVLVLAGIQTDIAKREAYNQVYNKEGK